MKVYLDNNATTRVDTDVITVMQPYLHEQYGNPNSTHREGQIARTAVDEARERLALYLHASPVEILFTSSATESNNWALKGVAEAMINKGRHIIISAVEHSSIVKSAEHLRRLGWDITTIPVGIDGHVQTDAVVAAMRDDTVLVSIQYANSETGAIMPVRDIGKICRKREIIFHTDATQAFQYLDANVLALHVDLLTCAAHKIYGPKATACLYIRKGTPIVPLIDGGQQEFDLRAGTENVPFIAGFGEAIKILEKNRDFWYEGTKKLRDIFENTLLNKIDGLIVNSKEPRLPNISNISFAGISADTFLARLDMEGIYASAGAACTSGSIQASSVLAAMGLPDTEAQSSIRFSFSHENTEEEVAYATEKIIAITSLLRNL